MFVPDEREHPFITAVRLILKLSRWPADFPDKWDKFPRCFTLSPAGVGSSDGGVVKFGFKWGFHGLPPDFRSPPCIYPNWPMFPPACWPCLYVNRTKRGAVHSEVSEVPSVGRRSSVSHALSSSPSARHFSPLPFVVVFYHHLAVWGIYVTDTSHPPSAPRWVTVRPTEATSWPPCFCLALPLPNMWKVPTRFMRDG